MDKRLQFVARLLEGEKMTALCREFGIARKTGYKIFDRYKDCGVVALSDRSRRPQRQANRLSAPIEARIVRVKREYPGWSAPKIRETLRQQVPDLPHCPAISTSTRCSIAPAWSTAAATARPSDGHRPDAAVGAERAVVCGLQGEFMLGNRRYCYPLTITDFASRYLLACDALTTTAEKFAVTVFERAFRDFRLPAAIRTDNGVPFASNSPCMA